MSEKLATKPTTGQGMAPEENARKLLVRIGTLELPRALHPLKSKGSHKPSARARESILQRPSTLSARRFPAEIEGNATDYPRSDESPETCSLRSIQPAHLGCVNCEVAPPGTAGHPIGVATLWVPDSRGEKDFKSFEFSNAFSKRNRRSAAY
jgi:hypothetical protein